MDLGPSYQLSIQLPCTCGTPGSPFVFADSLLTGIKKRKKIEKKLGLRLGLKSQFGIKFRNLETPSLGFVIESLSLLFSVSSWAYWTSFLLLAESAWSWLLLRSSFVFIKSAWSCLTWLFWSRTWFSSSVLEYFSCWISFLCWAYFELEILIILVEIFKKIVSKIENFEKDRIESDF